MDDVTLALAAIAQSHHARALDQLLSAWARSRSAALARLVQLVELCDAGIATLSTPPPVPDVPAALLAASPLARGGLLRGLATRDVDGDPDAWLDALLALPPDPRVLPVLKVLVHRLPLVWTDPEDELDDSDLDLRDPRTARFREVCARHVDARIGELAHGRPLLRSQSPPAVDDDFQPALIAAELALRQQLFDDAGDRDASAAFIPGDRETLVAYADWLTRRGDPRGAAIAWGNDMIASLAMHELHALWIGPLARAAYCGLEHGIVRTVRFRDVPRRARPLDWAALEIGWRPGWAAVEVLETPPAEVLAQVALPSLRVLACSHEDLAAAIEAGTDLTELEILSVSRWIASRHEPTELDAQRLQATLRAPQLRGLRELKLHSYTEQATGADAIVRTIEPLLVDPCGLHTLTVYSQSREWAWVPSARWLAALRRTGSPLRRFRGTGAAGERWVFGHASAGIDWLDVRVEWWGSEPNEYTAARVGEVVQAGARAITLVAKQPVAPDLLARLHSFPCELTIEIDPTLSYDRLES